MGGMAAAADATCGAPRPSRGRAAARRGRTRRARARAAVARRTLGAGALEVPEVCLGTMAWGEQNTETEAHTQLDYAVSEKGINFIDTAELYPVSSPLRAREGPRAAAD